jgi:hypothetical protein
MRLRTTLARALGRRPDPDPVQALARSGKEIVVSAGLMRSGSTWLFNALRLLLERAGVPVYALWVNDFDPERAREARTLVVKLHAANPVLAAAATRCYTCHRDLRDVVVSLGDMGLASDLDSQLRMLQEARDGYDFWAERSNLDLAYGRIVDDAPGVLAELANDLGLSIGATDLQSIAAALSGLDGAEVAADAPYDAVTLLHREHRFDGRAGRFVDSLDPAAEQLIVDAHGDWLARRGYLERPPRTG